MWQRLLFGILLAVAAYYVIQYFSNEGFVGFSYGTSRNSQGAMIKEQPSRGNFQVSSGGPNSPAASPSRNMPSQASRPPEASDPYDAVNEEADAPEQMRFPERSFSPGVIPKETVNHENAGLAGPVGESSQAFQQFSPESITNGGAFFGTVTAVEDENPNYSAF